MQRFTFLFISVYAVFCTLPAQSEEPAPLVTDRPDQTESPLTVPLHSLQIEMGFVYANIDDKEEFKTETESIDIASTLLRYGLFSDFELRLSGGLLSQKLKSGAGEINETGLAGITAGLKYHIHDEDQIIPESAIIAMVTMPVGHSDLVSKKAIPGFILVIGYTLSGIFSLSFNFGGLWADENPFIFRYSSALGIGISEKAGAFVEFFGAKGSNHDPILNFDAGLTYLLVSNFQIDVSAGYSVTPKPLELFFNAGFSWRIPN